MPRRSTTESPACGEASRSGRLPSILEISRRRAQIVSCAMADLAMAYAPASHICSCYVLIDSRGEPKSQQGFYSSTSYVQCLREAVRPDALESLSGNRYMPEQRIRNGTHLSDTRLARPAFAVTRRVRASGDGNLCQSAGRVPQAHRRHHHPGRRVSDRGG